MFSALAEISVEEMTWAEGDSVNVTLGPEDTVYCRLFDGKLNLIFDGFGLCRIVLDRVTTAHEGWWKIEVGVPGTVMLRRSNFYVSVMSSGMLYSSNLKFLTFMSTAYIRKMWAYRNRVLVIRGIPVSR